MLNGANAVVLKAGERMIPLREKIRDSTGIIKKVYQ
jgi:hypothetical protein